MQDDILLIILIVVHIILILIYMWYAKRTRYVPYSYAIWAFIIPIAGPAAGIFAVHESKKEKDYHELYRIVSGGEAKEVYDTRRNDSDIVAAEELFTINDVQDKRRAVLNILVDDKRQYIETIKLAAADKDQETAHYATATIMQVVNDFQDNLGRLQTIVSDPDSGEKELREYIKALSDFLDIQVMDDEMMTHYRLLLHNALKDAFKKYGCEDLAITYIKNEMKLGNITEAMRFADEVISRGNVDDRITLARLDIYIMQKDYEGIKAFIGRVRENNKLLSPELKEAFAFWEEEE